MKKEIVEFLDSYKVNYCGLLKNFKYDKNLENEYSEEINDTWERKGVYIIVSDSQKFIYPNGMSKTIYIGKSDNLYNRISVHKKWYKNISGLNIEEIKEDWWEYKYTYMREFGAKVFYVSTVGNQNSKSLERDIMESFYNKYLALPVGNGAFSF